MDPDFFQRHFQHHATEHIHTHGLLVIPDIQFNRLALLVEYSLLAALAPSNVICPP
jgi:hypothetical protein